MRTKIREIGNSRGVVLPAEVLDRIGLDVGEEVDIDMDAERIMLRPREDANDRRRQFIESMERVAVEDEKIFAALAKV